LIWPEVCCNIPPSLIYFKKTNFEINNGQAGLSIANDPSDNEVVNEIGHRQQKLSGTFRFHARKPAPGGEAAEKYE